MTIIDNKEITMLNSLREQLKDAEAIDIHVGYFYFSGFGALADELKDVKMRISVGSFIDPECIPEIINWSKEDYNFGLDQFQPRMRNIPREMKKEMYVKGLSEFVNKTSLYDSTSNKKALKIFVDKILNGSLEIKMSRLIEHGKMYIIHKKKPAQPAGVVIMGSSNFTYNGLIGQGELNDVYNEEQKYKEYCKKFEDLWNDSGNINIAIPDSAKDFVEKIKSELCFYQNYSPYEVYIRILDELFSIDENDNLKKPSQIAENGISDLKYQIDAIREGLKYLEMHNGAIIADVVGLGKSIIASTIAHNLGLPVIIITPPHLRDQWEDYQAQFKFIGTKIYTSGSLQKAAEDLLPLQGPRLIIIDEAHRYRNELTDFYQNLWQICRDHPENKILALTATPFNNDPKDVFALVKLFQTPGMSTIKSVDNLSLRFRFLIEKYNQLRRFMSKNPGSIEKINQERDEIALELKRLIEPVIIRRSRLDIKNITRYREDIERQGIDFPEVIGPEILEYELGQLSELYQQTLIEIIGDEKNTGFIGARYKPAEFIKNEKREEFLKYLKAQGLDETDLKTAQSNLAKIMRRLLVTRFESSKEAFRLTLDKMIASNELIAGWWNKIGKIPISKKGYIPNAEELLDDNNDNFGEQIDEELFEKQLAQYNQNGIITIDKNLIEDNFISQVESDIKLLTQIKEKWFGENSKTKEIDPKTDGLIKIIKEKIKENPGRKIVVFSAYADTANYLYEQLLKRKVDRIFKYASSDSSTQNKQIIKTNFDAGLAESKQNNEYDVLIATDALSEGYNLHRAGIVINYDIPYNPTRVIQRVGRINRVNKKVFDKIYIYNYFPTDIGEIHIRIKQISTLKINLINSVLGTDVKILSKDEELSTFFKEEFKKEEANQEQLSWFAPYVEEYNTAKENPELIKKIRNIKYRSSLIREGKGENLAVAFGKKGENSIFALKLEDKEPETVATEVAIKYFKAAIDEKGKPTDDQYDAVFELVRDQLFAKHALPQISGRRESSITVLKFLSINLPKSKEYCKDIEDIIRKYDDLNEGELKEIAQLKLKDLEADFEKLKNIVSRERIEASSRRVKMLEEETEAIVLSEEYRK